MRHALEPVVETLFRVKTALREMGPPSLLVALDYLELLADAADSR